MLLVTGFSAFPGVQANPTGLLVANWRQIQPEWAFGQTRFEVLPTEYDAAGARLEDLLAEDRPEYALMLGVSAVGRSVALERFALNLDDSELPDCAGIVRQGRLIRPGGPVAATTPVDLLSGREFLLARDVPVELSNHAGTYVCNHAYYRALTATQMSGSHTRVLFVHVPMLPAQMTQELLEKGYLEQLSQVVRALVDWLYLKKP